MTETTAINRRTVVKAAGATVCVPAFVDVAVADTASGDVELGADATVPANTTVQVEIFEDTNGSGNANNTEEQSLNDGINTYTYSTLQGLENESNIYWMDVQLSTTDDTVTPEVNSLEITLPAGDGGGGGGETTEEPSSGGARGGNALWDAFVKPDNLYLNLVTPSTMTDAVSVMFLGIMTGFGYFSVKLRSLLVGLGWMLLIVSFALAVLVDTSLIYFWLAVVFTAVMVVVALADGVVSG